MTYSNGATDVWHTYSGGGTNPYPFVGYNQWGGTVAPSTPSTIGAGTAGIQYGYGVPGFGQDLISILPDYLSYLQSAPGYIPGSGTYNQWNLSQPGLLTNINGQMVNARYGQGGTGDPTTGQEPQTPQEWVQGDKLFNSTVTSNWGQTDETRGMDYIANLFLRSDTPSGIGTPTWSAPEAYWQGLASQIAAGRIQPTARGWQLLQSRGYTPDKIGGVAPQQAASAGSGAGGNSMQDALASIAASNAADQAARLAYQEWQMRTGDEQLAQQKAAQAWQQTYQQASLMGTLGGQQTLAGSAQQWQQQYQQAQLDFQKEQAALAQRLAEAGLLGTYQGQQTMAAKQQEFAQKMAQMQAAMSEAGLTGTYNGQQTQQAQQQAWNQGFQQQQLGQQGALSLLQLQSQLQGPRDWAKYWQLGASAPEGLKSALGSLAGQYNFAPGAQGTPGAATLQSRTQDLLAPGGAAGTDGAAAGAGQAPNPWQFNLQNWSRMNPSMQQGVLGGLEAGGLYGPDVEALLKQAAPRYTGPATAQVGM
jgi:hypothetical protein